MVNVDFKNLRVVTGLVRFHYVNVFEPREFLEGGLPKYGACLIISGEDKETLNKINRAVEEAIKICQEQGMDVTAPGIFLLPLRDGDRERADKPEFTRGFKGASLIRYKLLIRKVICFR
jgi:hypothetical protein